MPIPAAFMKRGKKAAEGSTAEEKSESPKMEKGEGPEYGDAPHGKMGKKPCAACAKKGKKKGSCGCDKGGKMDAALTPMEYLDACDLGIQNRSRAYVRGVLGVREDKKCGASGIAEGKKCNKGVVGTVKSALGNENVQTGLKVAAVAGGIAAGTVGAMKYRGLQKNTLSNLRAAKTIRASGMGQGSAGRSAARTQARATLASGAAPLSKVRARKAAKAGVATVKAGVANAQTAAGPTVAKVRAGLNEGMVKTQAAMAQARTAAGPTVATVRARAQSDLRRVGRAARRTQIKAIRQKRNLFGGS